MHHVPVSSLIHVSNVIHVFSLYMYAVHVSSLLNVSRLCMYQVLMSSLLYVPSLYMCQVLIHVSSHIYSMCKVPISSLIHTVYQANVSFRSFCLFPEDHILHCVILEFFPVKQVEVL